MYGDVGRVAVRRAGRPVGGRSVPPGAGVLALGVDVQACERGAADLPAVGGPEVLVGVVAVPADEEHRLAVPLEFDDVVHGPHARRGVGAGEHDLGLVDVVHGDRGREPADTGHDGVASFLDTTIGDEPRVLREAVPEEVPVLGVDRPGVAGAEHLDRLDVEEGLHSRGRS